MNIYSSSQDFHFSQYYNAPLLVNPANTGFMPDNDYRIGGNYRDQWANLGSAYKTMSAWGDAKLFNNRFDNSWVGIGGMLMNDVAGGGTLNSYKAVATIAYHQLLGDNSVLSGGLGFGFVNKRVDIGKLTFDNQWNGKFFDITVNSNEPFVRSSVTYFDLQAGVNFAFFPADNIYVNMGVAAMHLNHPNESFFSNNNLIGQVQHRFTAFINSSIKIEDTWIINPNCYVSKMGNVLETVFGFNANKNLSGDGEQQLILGLYYRNKDALIPLIGYEMKDTRITFNYDATVSSLSVYNATQGAYEISIIKSGLFAGAAPMTKSVKCPALKF